MYFSSRRFEIHVAFQKLGKICIKIKPGDAEEIQEYVLDFCYMLHVGKNKFCQHSLYE